LPYQRQRQPLEAAVREEIVDSTIALPLRSDCHHVVGLLQFTASACRSIKGMQKPTYRVIPRKSGHAVDVEMTAPNSPPRIVNCFNKEADAWQWLEEQRLVKRLHEG
jgi:hypothetical protein